MPTSVVANLDRQIHALTSALVIARMMLIKFCTISRSASEFERFCNLQSNIGRRSGRRGQARRKRKSQIICVEQIDVSAWVASNAARMLGCNRRGSEAAGLASRHLTEMAASRILVSRPEIAAERGVDLAGNLLVDLGEDAEPHEENPREVKRVIDDLARGVLRGEFKSTRAIQCGCNATSWRTITVKAAATASRSHADYFGHGGIAAR